MEILGRIYIKISEDKMKEIKLTKNELWDFTYKEICKNLKCSKCDFALSTLYDGFKRRFGYFLNGKRI